MSSFFAPLKSKVALAFAVAVTGHVLLFLHITFCSHRSQAIDSLNPEVLHFSIAEVIEGKTAEIMVKSADVQSSNSAQKTKYGAGISTIKPVVTAPRFLQYSPPEYPRAAIKQGLEGVVIVDVELDHTGSAEGASVFSSSGYNILDRAALRAANRSSYEQLVEEGEGKDYIARVRYDFVLKDSK